MMFNHNMEHGHWRRGRPKETWMRSVEREMKALWWSWGQVAKKLKKSGLVMNRHLQTTHDCANSAADWYYISIIEMVNHNVVHGNATKAKVYMF